MTSIHDAVEADDIGQVAELLDSDPGLLETRNVLNDTPLHVAAQQGHRGVVELLVNRGADVNATGNQNFTPLHYAVQEDYLDLASFLLQHGADVEMKTRQGATPLQVACLASPRIAEVLIRHGAKVDLNCAIRLNDTKAVQRFLKGKKSLTAVASFPNHLLEDAISTRNSEIVDLLLAYTRHPTPLELARSESLLFRVIEQAMSERNLMFVQKLLEAGVPVDVRNQGGETPLGFIMKFRTSGTDSPTQSEIKQEIIQLLRGRGARE
jgi:ankyrin repeat protein